MVAFFRNAVLMLAFASLGVGAQNSHGSSISEKDAKQLVFAALPSKDRHLPGLAFDVGVENRYKGFDRFYILSVTWAGPPDGSVVVGGYYVDRYTGDVWDAAMDCYEYDNPDLRKLQVSIRKRIGMSPAEYQKVKVKGPMCDD